MNIIDFLNARITEDETLANAAIQPEEMHPYGDTTLPQTSIAAWGDEVRGYLGGTWGEHCANWHPARVLAECAAKRAIMEQATVATGLDMSVDNEYGIEPRNTKEDPYCGNVILYHLATTYADHPDYQQEWAP